MRKNTQGSVTPTYDYPFLTKSNFFLILEDKERVTHNILKQKNLTKNHNSLAYSIWKLSPVHSDINLPDRSYGLRSSKTDDRLSAS